jgi:hypothetical protein
LRWKENWLSFFIFQTHKNSPHLVHQIVHFVQTNGRPGSSHILLLFSSTTVNFLRQLLSPVSTACTLCFFFFFFFRRVPPPPGINKEFCSQTLVAQTPSCSGRGARQLPELASSLRSPLLTNKEKCVSRAREIYISAVSSDAL